MFWQNAQARWIKHGKKWNQFKLPENDILIDYANGLQPLYYVKWPDVDIVYVPINVQTSHWVLGVVHLHRRIIYVYDSLMGINNNARLQVAIKPLAKLLPYILNVIAYYGFHGDTKLTTRNEKLNGYKIFLNRNMMVTVACLLSNMLNT
ncbi:uncharacterized protein LOC117927286 [Vitis riparia]|uniref:uncharacterized protein LOC117927286 n=1 Tax=Vitis riparia TaxID=96939 RepID=UPI00155AB69C|nr:uncharacterized protein LOC117927286 [Vitis riparia]